MDMVYTGRGGEDRYEFVVILVIMDMVYTKIAIADVVAYLL